MSGNQKIILAAGVGAAVLAAGVIFLLLGPFRVAGTAFLKWGSRDAIVIAPAQEALPMAPTASPFRREIRILLVGDLMFDRDIRLAARQNGNDFIFAKLSDFLAGYDLVAANLEGPITDEMSVSVGSAPGSRQNFIFTFDPSLAGTLFGVNIRLLNLGNNHILNFGQRGVEETINYLTESRVDFFGAPGGSRGAVKELKGMKIGFVNYNQFVGNFANEEVLTVEEIKKLKAEADIVVVYAHWGIEYAAEANNAIKTLARKFADAGADLIIGSHPHVVQPSEEYAGAKIYYSLGNFVFDQYFNFRVREGMGVGVKIDRAGKISEFEEIKFYLESNGQTGLKEDEKS